MKNVKIGPKLIVSSLFTAALMIFMGTYTMKSLTIINGETDMLYENGAVPLGILVKTAYLLQETRLSVRHWQVAKTDKERAAALKTIDDMYAEIKGLLSRQKELVLEETCKKSLNDLEASIDRYIAEARNFLRTAKNFSTEGVNTDNVSPAYIKASEEMLKALDTTVEKEINSASALSNNATELTTLSKNIAFAIMVIALLFSTGFSIFLTFSITSPLKVMVSTLNNVEKGDMTVRASLQRGDELGSLSNALDSSSSKLRFIFEHLQRHSGILVSTAEELSSVGRQMADAAEASISHGMTVVSASEQAAVSIRTIASNAEKTSISANDVASSAEEMSVNMHTIASAIEEMSASISEISSNAHEVGIIANEATVKSHDATEVMSKLGLAAKEIGHVTDIIKRIADKTNLLALNATIEAASAGAAGKGFTVVAGEIKELAHQSADSADDIAHRIESIQLSASNAIKVIDEVAEIITKINHSVESISIHVGEQTKASNEIASNVSQANVGAKRVASAIGEVAKSSSEIAHNAGEAAKGAGVVNQGVNSITHEAQNSTQGAKQTSHRADELAGAAGNLKRLLSQFKT